MIFIVHHASRNLLELEPPIPNSSQSLWKPFNHLLERLFAVKTAAEKITNKNGPPHRYQSQLHITNNKASSVVSKKRHLNADGSKLLLDIYLQSNRPI